MFIVFFKEEVFEMNIKTVRLVAICTLVALVITSFTVGISFFR